MDKLCRWAANHKKLYFFIASFIFVTIYSICLPVLNAPLWLIIVVDLIHIIFFYLQALSSSLVILQKAAKQLNDYCDPYPLLNECESFLKNKNSVYSEQVLLIDKCAALLELGEIQKAYDILSAINIDKSSSMTNEVKVTYYYTIMVACHELGMNEQAEVFYAKILLMYPDIKDKKLTNLLESDVKMAKALCCFRKGEYEEIINIISTITPGDLRQKVINSFTYAKAYLALGDTEKAKDHLVFVIVNGNKLGCVKEAQELLKTTPYADILKSFSMN